MIYGILALAIFMFLLSYITLGRDIFQPAVLVSASYIVSVLCAIMNQDLWKVNYHFYTFIVILIGLSVFYSANLCVYIITRKSRIDVGAEKQQLTPIKVSPIIFFAIIFFQLVTLVLYYNEVRKIGGTGSFTDMMFSYRMATAYDTEENISGFVSQLSKVSLVCSIVFLYIFIKNIFIDGIKGNFHYVYPVALYFFQAILTGGRFNLLIVVCSAILFYDVIYHKKYGMKKRLKLKSIVLILLFLFAAVFIFYAIRELVGRKSDEDFITYVTTYIGGSIPLLDMYLQAPVASSDIWGKETFYTLLKNLRQLNLIDIPDYIVHLEFRSSNGVNIGNVYTAFRRQIQDFGIFGMVVLQFLQGMLFCALYAKLYSRKNNDFVMLIYGHMVYVLFLHSINDCFYQNCVSLGFAETIIIYVIILFIVKRVKIRGIARINHRELYGKKQIS